MAAAKKKASAKKKGPSPFEAVWKVVLRVPRGKVITYGQVSQMIDRRLTPVGVGWALRAAPDGALPWHRVVSASGGISTDKEHPDLQRKMLEREGVRFIDGCVDLSRHAFITTKTNVKAKTKKKTVAKKPRARGLPKRRSQ